MGSIFKINGRVSYGALILSIIIPLAVGFTSTLLVGDSYEMFQQINKPSFAPPGWIFGPVWTILYILMGIASYRIWMQGIEKREVRVALFFYGFQLILNFLWTIIFFGLQLMGLAFIEIITLLIFIIITAVRFYKIDKVAGYLLIPYILWVSFAAILNFSIWRLNR